MLEQPKPGQVIDYRCLWWNEHRRGSEEGRKKRPCAVVFAVERQDGSTRVYVLPVTHTKPFDGENGIEILPQWKRLLRLDDQPSWIITTELNHFEWPGPDVVGNDTCAITRGTLPYKVTTRLRELILARIREKTIRPVDRDLALANAPAPRRSKNPGQDPST